MTYKLLKREDLQKVLSPVIYFKYLYLQQNMSVWVCECECECECVCVCVLVFVVYEDISYEYTPHWGHFDLWWQGRCPHNSDNVEVFLHIGGPQIQNFSISPHSSHLPDFVLNVYRDSAPIGGSWYCISSLIFMFVYGIQTVDWLTAGRPHNFGISQIDVC